MMYDNNQDVGYRRNVDTPVICRAIGDINIQIERKIEHKIDTILAYITVIEGEGIEKNRI